MMSNGLREEDTARVGKVDARVVMVAHETKSDALPGGVEPAVRDSSGASHGAGGIRLAAVLRGVAPAGQDWQRLQVRMRCCVRSLGI